MKTAARLAAALALSATPLLAQETDTALRDAAADYVGSVAMQTALDQLLSTETFVAQLEASGLRLDPAQTETLATIVQEEFDAVRPDMEDAMTEAAAGTFTMAELEALNAFYASDEGRSIATKMQPFMETFYGEVGPSLQDAQARIAERADAALSPGAPGSGEAPAGE